MFDEQVTIISNEPIAPSLHIVELAAPQIASCAEPGQFVHLRIPDFEGHVLRRPFSIYRWDGGSGTISVWANLMPEKVHEMCWDYLEGRTAKAAATQLEYLPLINDFFVEVNPIPIKEAMNMAGMGVGGFRLPLYEMEEKNRAVLRAEMQKMGLI